MRVYKRAVPAIAVSLPDLVGNVINQVSGIAFQAPEGNAQIVYFGDKNQQPFELRPKANAFLPVNQAKDVYILGTAPDTISIVFF